MHAAYFLIKETSFLFKDGQACDMFYTQFDKESGYDILHYNRVDAVPAYSNH